MLINTIFSTSIVYLDPIYLSRGRFDQDWIDIATGGKERIDAIYLNVERITRKLSTRERFKNWGEYRMSLLLLFFLKGGVGISARLATLFGGPYWCPPNTMNAKNHPLYSDPRPRRCLRSGTMVYAHISLEAFPKTAVQWVSSSKMPTTGKPKPFSSTACHKLQTQNLYHISQSRF